MLGYDKSDIDLANEQAISLSFPVYALWSAKTKILPNSSVYIRITNTVNTKVLPLEFTVDKEQMKINLMI